MTFRRSWLVPCYLTTIVCSTVAAVAKLHPAYILYIAHNWIGLFAWLSSLFMLSGMYVVGKKLWWGWILNISAMPFFLCIDLHYRLWGFIMFNFITTSIATKNLIVWYKGRHAAY